MTAWYLAVRYLGSIRQFFNMSISLSVLGMMIGVSSLVVSMAVFSGYVTTLEKTVQDAVGHLIVAKRGVTDKEELFKDISPYVPGMVAETPYLYAEAILANKGQVTGVVIEGIDEATVHKVLNFKSRLIDGTLDLSTGSTDEAPKVLIGKGIAKRFGFKVGDTFRIVIPLASEFEASAIKPKLGKFTVAGIVNFGRYDFDARYVVMPIHRLQEFGDIGKRVSGYRIRIEDPKKTPGIILALRNKFGTNISAKDWREMNQNLFEAAKLEKAVLFFVLMILVVAAAFNIANTLFISVVQRYRDISVLKTLGAPSWMIHWVFTVQGLIVGSVGAILGIVVGLMLCRLFEWVQVAYKIIPPEIYKLDHIDLDVNFLDLLVIVLAALLVCFIATWVPSRRGAKISPVEGLRYE